MKNKKRIIKPIIVALCGAIVTIVFVFCVSAIVQWKINVMEWRPSAIFITSVISVFSSVFVFLLILVVEQDFQTIKKNIENETK